MLNFLIFFLIINRRVFFIYSTTMVAAFFIINIPTFLEARLPINVALPYLVQNSKFNFCVTYVHQTVALYADVSGHIVPDDLFFGFLFLIRRQQKILKYRLQNITVSCNLNSSRAQRIIFRHRFIKQCIKNYKIIYR